MVNNRKGNKCSTLCKINVTADLCTHDCQEISCKHYPVLTLVPPTVALLKPHVQQVLFYYQFVVDWHF